MDISRFNPAIPKLSVGSSTVRATSVKRPSKEEIDLAIKKAKEVKAKQEEKLRDL